MMRFLSPVFLLCVSRLAATVSWAAEDVTLPITISPVTVLLIEEREISFRDPGLLDSLLVTEGTRVEQDQPLASLDSRKEEFAVETANVSLQAAELQLNNPLPVETARAALEETRAALKPLEAALHIAQQAGASRTLIELAETDRDTAKVEFERAQRARERMESSVSLSEVVRLEALAKKGVLGVQNAEHEHGIAQLQPSVHEAEIAGQQMRIARHELLLQQEVKALELQRLTVAARKTDLQLAELALARRSIRAPLSGVIAEVFRKPGEWVEPGTVVLRLVQLKRLRVEGYVDVSLALQGLHGRRVSITLSDGLRSLGEVSGQVTHVSSEVDDRVKQDVRIQAEFDNQDLRVMPGMVGSMTIHSETVVPVPAKADCSTLRSRDTALVRSGPSFHEPDARHDLEIQSKAASTGLDRSQQ